MTRLETNTKRFLIAASFLALLVIIGVVGYRLFSPAHKTTQSAAAAPTPLGNITGTNAARPLTTIVPSSVETLTVYPGVTDVEYLVDQGNGRGWSVKGNYNVDATASQLLQFYDEDLPKVGWILDSTSSTATNEALGGDLLESHEYFWADRTRSVPWNLNLEVAVDQMKQSSPQATLMTKVQVTLSRQPALDRVDFYPGARQVESHWESSSTIQGFGKTYFSYSVEASPDDVRAYYEHLAPQSDWLADGNAHDITTDGISFVSHSDGPKEKRDTYLTIRANLTAAGETAVHTILAVQLVPH